MDDYHYGIKELKAASRRINKPVVARIKAENMAIINRNQEYKAELRNWFRSVYPRYDYDGCKFGYNKWDRVPRAVFDLVFSSSWFSGNSPTKKFTSQNPVIQWITGKPTLDI